jgi:hypothetical protein
MTAPRKSSSGGVSTRRDARKAVSENGGNLDNGYLEWPGCQRLNMDGEMGNR